MAIQTYSPIVGNAGFLFPDNIIKSVDVKLREQTVVSEGRTLVRQTRKVGGERYEATVRTIPLKRGSAEFQAAVGTMGAIRGRSQRFYLPMPRTSDTDVPSVGDYISVVDNVTGNNLHMRQILGASNQALLPAGTYADSAGALTPNVGNLNVELSDHEMGLYTHTWLPADINGTNIEGLNGMPVLAANAESLTLAGTNVSQTASSGSLLVTVNSAGAHIDLATFADVPEGTRYLFTAAMRMDDGDSPSSIGFYDQNGSLCTAAVTNSWQTFTIVATASSDGIRPRLDLASVTNGQSLRVETVRVSPIVYVDRPVGLLNNYAGIFSHAGSTSQLAGYNNNMLVSMNSDIHEIGFADSGFVEFEFDVIERL